MSRVGSSKISKPRLFWGLVTVFACVGLVLAQGGKDAKPAAANKYIGAEKCKNCHAADTSGNQYAAWQKSGHAKAYATLATDKAKEYAKAKKIEDPQKSDECMKCHRTAFGVAADQIKKGFDPNQGVQCESCHGPGEQHMKARFAAAAKAGAEGAADEKGKVAERQTLPAGEIIAKVDQKTCLECHNEQSPGFKPFCFLERSAKIAHHDPRKPRVAGDELVCNCGEKCGCVHGCEAGKCGIAAKDKDKK